MKRSPICLLSTSSQGNQVKNKYLNLVEAFSPVVAAKLLQVEG